MSIKLDIPEQKHLILSYLQTGAGISAARAINEFKCYRLAAVVHRLRDDGWKIVTRQKTSFTGRRYAEYFLM